MAFGQQSGPPASTKEVAELEALLGEAGYSSFREARHIYGLSQRQAAGKFTRTEAADLLERLTTGDGGADDPPPESSRTSTPSPRPSSRSAARTPTSMPAVAATEQAERRRADRQAEQVAALPDELLADELVRRGWVCIPPG